MSIGGPSAGIPQRAIAEVYSPRGKNKPASRRRFGLDKVLLLLVMLYLLVPLGATLAFGLATGNGINFSTYQQSFSDPDFSKTILTSLGLAFGATFWRSCWSHQPHTGCNC